MTSRERQLAAMLREPVDYVPLEIGFWTPVARSDLSWDTPEEQMRTCEILGIDKQLSLGVTPGPPGHVETRVWQTEEAGIGYPVLHKEFLTPDGVLSAAVKRAPDWPWGEDIPFFDDFSPPRYVKPWVESGEDVQRLRHVLSLPSGTALDRWARRARNLTRLARDHDALLSGNAGCGLDFVCWMCGFERAVLLALDSPEVVEDLLDIIGRLNLEAIDLLCEQNVDVILRRGWYESTDYWSPSLFERFAAPLLDAEVARAHGAGTPVQYLVVTGIMGIIGHLAERDFDMLIQMEPVLGNQDQSTIVARLANRKSFQGGISAPMHLGARDPRVVRQAVREAFEVFGRRGFMLGCSAGIRSSFPWANVEAMIEEWTMLREEEWS